MTWKLVAQLVAVVAVVVAVAALLFRVLVAESAPTDAPVEPRVAPAVTRPAVTPAVEPAPAAVVATVEGVVERSRGDGDWERVAQGDRLEANSALRTGAGSAAELRVGDATRLSAGAETEVGVEALDGQTQRFKLKRGRLAAVVDASKGRVVRIEDESGAAVEATAAKFAVMNSGQVLAVATEAGGVTLMAAGKTVEVQAGEVALAEAGGPPSPAAPLPKDLVLKVVRAKQTGRALCATVDGVAAPGAEVRVAGALVPVGRDGRFRVEVPRETGRAGVVVATRDVSGRTREEHVACALQPQPAPTEKPVPPVSGIKVKWDGSRPE